MIARENHLTYQISCTGEWDQSPDNGKSILISLTKRLINNKRRRQKANRVPKPKHQLLIWNDIWASDHDSHRAAHMLKWVTLMCFVKFQMSNKGFGWRNAKLNTWERRFWASLIRSARRFTLPDRRVFLQRSRIGAFETLWLTRASKF